MIRACVSCGIVRHSDYVQPDYQDILCGDCQLAVYHAAAVSDLSEDLKSKGESKLEEDHTCPGWCPCRKEVRA